MKNKQVQLIKSILLEEKKEPKDKPPKALWVDDIVKYREANNTLTSQEKPSKSI